MKKDNSNKRIMIIGRIGNTEYQNNDRCKVLHRGGCTKVIYSACSHGDIPLVVRKKEIGSIGFFDSGTGKHQSNTVYAGNKCIPAITTIEGGGTQQIKVLRKCRRKSKS